MRKTILTVIGATLVAASLMQAAVAAEHHHARNTDRAPVSASQQFRDANDQIPSLAEQDFEYWQGHGMSPPAGR
jgi:hypothetical protein